MAVVNTNVNASIAQNALARKRPFYEHRDGAPVYRAAHQQCIR